MVTGAGGLGFTTLPSGATILIGRSAPSLCGIVLSKNVATATNTDEKVLAIELFLKPAIWSELPVKSKVSVSLTLVTVTLIGTSTSLKQSVLLPSTPTQLPSGRAVMALRIMASA